MTAPAPIQFSLIFLNWNRSAYLMAALASCATQTHPPFEVIVVDNASTDNSQQECRSRFPQAKLLAMKSNLGFAAGINQGILAARGPYLFLLNNDLTLAPDCLEHAARAVSTAADSCAFWAPKMLRYDQPQTIDSLGIACSFAQVRDLGQGLPDGPDFASPKEVFGACAGAAIYRREIFTEVGRFDEKFGFYFEDVDLSFRIRLRGHSCYTIPQARVYHRRGGSSTIYSDFYARHTTRNRAWTYLANLPKELLCKHYDTIWQACRQELDYYSRRGQYAPLWQSRLELWQNLRYVLGKNRQNMARSRLSLAEIETLMVDNYLSK